MPTLTVTLVTGAGMLAVWYAVVLGTAIAGRPRIPKPGPPSMDLGAEPPAVVNLLVTGCHLTADAADATLLDLAARGIIELHQPGEDPSVLLVRVRAGAQASGLAPYERRVLERVWEIAGDRLTPLEEITGRYAEGGPDWLRQLRVEVIRDARARGLSRERRPSWVVVVASAVAAFYLTGLALAPFAPQPDRSPAADAGIGVGLLVGVSVVFSVLLAIGILHSQGERYTPAGVGVAARWLGVARWLSSFESLADLPPAAVAVWDRYLAYGVALGTNPVASHALDLSTGRVARFVSGYGGRVRPVVVRYPWSPLANLPAGVRLVWSAAVLLFWAGFWAFLPGAPGGWPPAARLSLYAAAILLPARAAYRLVRATIDILAPVTVEGVVIAEHPYRETLYRSDWYQMVLDDGEHERTRPWTVRTGRPGALTGDVVRIRGQRWSRYAMQVSVVTRNTP